VIKFIIPIRTKNPLNGAQWGRSGIAKAKLRKKHREAAKLSLMALLSTPGGPSHRIEPEATVTLRRVSPRALDGDGLQAALKSVRDGIADALGINDGSDAVTWVYQHRRGRPREYAVEVEILPQQEQAETREAMT
jgi:hypothetical protein